LETVDSELFKVVNGDSFDWVCTIKAEFARCIAAAAFAQFVSTFDGVYSLFTNGLHVLKRDVESSRHFFFKYLNLDRDVVEVDNFFEIIFDPSSHHSHHTNTTQPLNGFSCF